MTAMQVKAPVEGFNGEVAGVAFVDGVGETDDPTAIAYFRRRGYEVVARKAPAKKASAKQGK